MNRLLLLLLYLLVTPACAAQGHEWYVLKTDDCVFAFDTNAVETASAAGVKSINILVGTRDGYTNAVYYVDCRTNRGAFAGGTHIDDREKTEELMMVEGSTKPSDPGWSAIPEKGSMKIAADVVCARPVAEAIHVDSEKAAIDRLKMLSN